MLLGLLLHTLAEHPLNLLLRETHVFQSLLLIPGGVVGEHIGLVEPVQQLLGDLLLEGDILKILQEGAVKGVKVRLALHQKAPAQVVKPGKAGLMKPLVEGLHQCHPLGEGDFQAVSPE